MTEQRLFQRIKFAVETEVEIAGTRHDATLMDIALKGALVAFQDEPAPERGMPCHLTIHLSQSDVALDFEGVIVHSHDRLTGIKFTTINIDSMIHLRSLIELNSGDPDQVRSELNFFIDAG